MALPRLPTARLVLCPAVDMDADRLWAIWREPEVRRYLFDDEPVARERVDAILSDSLTLADRGLGLWTVAAHGDVAVLGCVGLLPVAAAAQHAPALGGEIEVLASLVPAVWRRGYAREALRAVIDYAFGTLQMTRLVGIADVPNEASHRMLRDLGFTPTGEHDGPRYRARSYVLCAPSFTAAPDGA